MSHSGFILGKIGRIWLPNCELVGRNVMLVCISIILFPAPFKIDPEALPFVPNSTGVLFLRLKNKLLKKN